jgi:hypothetical protein
MSQFQLDLFAWELVRLEMFLAAVRWAQANDPGLTLRSRPQA